MPAIINFLQQTGFYMFGQDGNWKCLIMIAISFILMYLAAAAPAHFLRYAVYQPARRGYVP